MKHQWSLLGKRGRGYKLVRPSSKCPWSHTMWYLNHWTRVHFAVFPCDLKQSITTDEDPRLGGKGWSIHWKVTHVPIPLLCSFSVWRMSVSRNTDFFKVLFSLTDNGFNQCIVLLTVWSNIVWLARHCPCSCPSHIAWTYLEQIHHSGRSTRRRSTNTSQSSLIHSMWAESTPPWPHPPCQTHPLTSRKLTPLIHRQVNPLHRQVYTV